MPRHLIATAETGLPDAPVRGRHVLEQAVKVLPHATVTELAGVGHYPQSEAPQAVAAAVRMRGDVRSHRVAVRVATMTLMPL